MLRKDPFENGYSYHIYNRGVEKRSIFRSKYDYERFLFILEEFNTFTPANNTSRNLVISKRDHDQPLVVIHNYCLMHNHFHLIIEQVNDNGISKFLQKIMTGYTMYFNKKYNRSGVVFQGRTKSKLIHSNEYFMWLKDYFAFNPIDICDPDWKNVGIKDT